MKQSKPHFFHSHKVVAKQHGFSLIELLIAMSITGIALFTLPNLYLSNLKNNKRFGGLVNMGTEATLILDFLRLKTQNAGGSGLPAWAAIWVEDNCLASGMLPPCRGSDRTTIFNTDESVATCQVVGQISSNVIRLNDPSGICCLKSTELGRQAILRRELEFRNIRLQNIDEAQCLATIETGQAQSMNTYDTAIPNFVGSSLYVTDAKTFFLTNDRNFKNGKLLIQYEDLNRNGAINDADWIELADHISDFQISVAYDFDSKDQNIRDNNSIDDEWLHNSKAIGINESTFFEKAQARDMAFIKYKIVMASPDFELTGETKTKTLNNEKEIKNQFLVLGTMAYLRNRDD